MDTQSCFVQMYVIIHVEILSADIRKLNSILKVTILFSGQFWQRLRCGLRLGHRSSSLLELLTGALSSSPLTCLQITIATEMQ
jgi:hypothetical protein